MPAQHIYTDESKRRDYVMAAFILSATKLQPMRQTIQALLLPGQTYLHMKNESDGRKNTIARTLVYAGVQASIYRGGEHHKTHKARRARCLQTLVTHWAGAPETLLVIDRDDTLVSFDNRTLIEATRVSRTGDSLRYEHRSDKTELLLGVPDAIAWCWAKGGQWRQLIQPAIAGVYAV